MNMLRKIGSELLGLFVDDWAFALLIIVWVGLFTALSPRLPHTVGPSVLFFAGFAALVVGFALRKAR